MKGYDPAFRLCRISGSDAEKIFFVYECFDAFPLRYGEDLYGRLMHVKENQKALKGRFQEEELAFPPGWNAFLDSLYSAPFQPVPENKPYGSVPLRILMKDKTQVELHLYENGWIEYQNQYVHMEGEILAKSLPSLKRLYLKDPSRKHADIKPGMLSNGIFAGQPDA